MEMDAFFTTAVDATRLSRSEERNGERDLPPRRKRAALPRPDQQEESPATDFPEHALDDLA